MSGTTQGNKKRDRSPSYPAIGLEEALARARRLYDQERRNAAPVDTILKHWGYSAGSGAGLRVLAALEKFGLTVDEGSGPNRKARLTEDAYDILIDERPDSENRQRLIRQAALNPTVHADLWEQYKTQLPSQDTLKYELRKKGFTERALSELIDRYEATIAFARLDANATLPEDIGDRTEYAPPGEGTRHPQSKRQQFQVPVSSSRVVILDTPFPLAETEWKQLMRVLEAMQPAIAPEATPIVSIEPSSEDRITVEAQRLLASVDDGGVPMYRNERLDQIARENNVEFTDDSTPNQMIDALRAKRDA